MHAARSVSVAGLADVLRGQADVRDVVQRNPNSANLTLLPAGHPKGIPTRLLALDSFNRLLETSTRDYDLVIIDSPPSFVGGDCLLLSQKVDKTVLIAKWGVDHRPGDPMRRYASNFTATLPLESCSTW
jgi:Mrp family chromosome partitioning ATPase